MKHDTVYGRTSLVKQSEVFCITMLQPWKEMIGQVHLILT